MADEEIVSALPWPILYIVHSLYDLMSDDQRPFLLHKDTGVSSDIPLPESEVFARATEQDYNSLQFAGEDSRGAIINIVDQEITRILYRG